MVIKKIIRKVLMRFLPIKKKRIVFSSFDGHYSDNPRFISEAFHQLYPELPIIWLLDEKNFESAPTYVKKIKINSFYSFLYEGTARVLVDNVYGHRAVELTNQKFSKIKYIILNYLNNKKGQSIITTWHGTPLKRMGRDQVNSPIIDFACPNTTMILGNRYTLEIMEHLSFGKINMKLIGTPRNDILFNNSEAHKNEIKKKLQLPLGKKILLFAPTFRKDYSGTLDRDIQRSGIDQLDILNIDQFFEELSKKFGGDWVLICRFHYHVEALVDWETLNKKYSGRIFNGNRFDEMAEYLLCSDILLTDASSSMFDFALTEKPCFLFFPDLQHYETEERGFYMLPEELPFPLAQTSKELIENIQNFNQSIYLDKLDQLNQYLGVIDYPTSSREVVNYISSVLFNKVK